MSSTYLGIDIGGSGIKSALVDVDQGSLLTERQRVKTPQPATPEAVAEVVASVVGGYDYEGPIGVGFPAVIRSGTVETANNIDKSWIGHKVVKYFTEAVGRELVVINDADAAGLAEVKFGAAKGVDGIVLVIPFGTGIGSGLIFNGKLEPNLELGQIELDGYSPAEIHFSAKVRRKEDLSWDEWGERANRFLVHVNKVFNPDLMVLGGGLTKHWEKYSDQFDDAIPVVPAEMGNSAGLVGAALAISQSQTR